MRGNGHPGRDPSGGGRVSLLRFDQTNDFRSHHRFSKQQVSFHAIKMFSLRKILHLNDDDRLKRVTLIWLERKTEKEADKKIPLKVAAATAGGGVRCHRPGDIF